MKHRILITQLIIVLIIPLLAFRDKCNSDALYEQALVKLKKCSLVKDYRVYMKKNKKLTPDDYEYFTIPLNRGVKYKFLAVSSGDFDGKLVMNLYNNPKKEFVFASNMVQGGSSFTVKESIEFKCASTGNFCIGFYFTDGKEGCGVAVAAFQQD